MRARISRGVFAVGVVAALGVSIAIAAVDRHPAAHAATTSMTQATVGTTVSATRGRTGRPGGRWSALPVAPILGRDPDVAVWTGATMLVWGGSSSTGSRNYSDGATYDPATRTWATLPRSPLSARTGTAWAWTGRLLFVWGGTDSHDRQRSDGALYDPHTRRWTTLPPVPVPAYSSARAVRTGGQVVLLTTPPGPTWDHIITQAYDPAGHRWHTLPTLRLRAKHDGMVLRAVTGAGGRVYAWSQWAHSTKTPDGYVGTFGIDGYTLVPAIVTPSGATTPATWSPNRFTWRGHDAVDGPLWTGREILLPASQLWCGLCPGPYQLNSKGSRLNPATGTDRAIAHGPADDQNGQYVWTGSVLLVANTSTTITGPGQDVHPGQAAYWSPSTNRWTVLPQAPLAGAAAVVWTGHRLLVWGLLAPIHGQEPLHTAGLQLG